MSTSTKEAVADTIVIKSSVVYIFAIWRLTSRSDVYFYVWAFVNIYPHSRTSYTWQ